MTGCRALVTWGTTSTFLRTSPARKVAKGSTRSVSTRTSFLTARGWDCCWTHCTTARSLPPSIETAWKPAVKACFLENKTGLRQLRQHLVVAVNYVCRTQQPSDVHMVFIARRRAEDQKKERCVATHDKKLAKLLQHASPTSNARSLVVKLSTKTLSNIHGSLLSKGHDFALAPCFLPNHCCWNRGTNYGTSKMY